MMNGRLYWYGMVWPTSYETQSVLICIMRDGAIHYKLYLLKLTMAVDNSVLRINNNNNSCLFYSDHSCLGISGRFTQ